MPSSRMKQQRLRPQVERPVIDLGGAASGNRTPALRMTRAPRNCSKRLPALMPHLSRVTAPRELRERGTGFHGGGGAHRAGGRGGGGAGGGGGGGGEGGAAPPRHQADPAAG